MTPYEAKTRRQAQGPPIDGVKCVRAASTALTVLLLGGVLNRAAVFFLPAARFWWLPLVAVVGYFVAGMLGRDAARPALQGAAAAFVAWGLMAIGRITWGFAGYTTAATFAELIPALVIGAAAGWYAGVRFERAEERKRQTEAAERRDRAAAKAERRARRRDAKRPRDSS